MEAQILINVTKVYKVYLFFFSHTSKLGYIFCSCEPKIKIPLLWACWREQQKEVKWEEKEGEKGIGSAAVATTGTTPSDHSATDASNPASSSTPKPPLIPSGSLVLAIGSAPVSYFAPNHLQINQFLFFFVYSWLCFMNWALGPVFVFSHLICSHMT